MRVQFSAEPASSAASLIDICYFTTQKPAGGLSGPGAGPVVCFEGPLDLSGESGSIVLTPRPDFAGPTPEVQLSAPGYGGPPEAWHDLYPHAPVSLKFPIAVGLAILLLGWLAIGRGWLGSTLRPYALTLPVATAVPLIGIAINSYASGPATVLVALLVPLAMLPLAIDFLGRIEDRRSRWLVGCITVGLAVAAVLTGLLVPVVPGMYLWRSALAGGVAFVPGLLAAHPLRRSESIAGQVRPWWRSVLARALSVAPGRFAARMAGRLEAGPAAGSGRSPRALVESFDVLLAAMTPGIAAISLVSVETIQIWPILLWLGVLLVATRVVLRPLARLATAATRQRDLVVSATEAERARIAADIHDDALQDLSMLVRRLDAAGDKANAKAAREISERLRAICGDLRLPVLDDLGVGPALEWLCNRVDPSAREIELDRLGEESRLPADVELAVFRIAQEALSNAIRHGAMPIVVRYRARPDWAELDVDDSGRGIAGDAGERAEQTGHMGLLNMAQRAEAIGGNLQIGRRSQGGTRVALVWDRAAAAGAVAVPAQAAT